MASPDFRLSHGVILGVSVSRFEAVSGEQRSGRQDALGLTDNVVVA